MGNDSLDKYTQEKDVLNADRIAKPIRFKDWNRVFKNRIVYMVKNIDVSFLLQDEKPNPGNGSDIVVDYPIPKQRKYEKFIRDKIKKGDIFAASYANETLIVSVKRLGDQYYPHVDLQPEVLYIGNERYDLSKYYFDASRYTSSKLLPGRDLDIASNNFNVEIPTFEYSDSFILASLMEVGKFYWSGELSLYPNLGLFNRVLYDDKYINIPYLDNSRDVVADKLFISCFEPYFYIPVPFEALDWNYENEIDKDYIVFRKINEDINTREKSQKLGQGLLLDACDLNCAVQYAYDVIEDVANVKYKNTIGKEYVLGDILKFINRMLAVTDRTLTSHMVVLYFSDHYQRQENKGEQFVGFSSAEIITLLNRYFRMNVAGGFYPGYDTYWVENNDFFEMDCEWFGMFFDAIKRSKNKDIRSLDDIKVYQRHEEFFKLFSLPQDQIMNFINLAKECNDKDDFIGKVKRIIVDMHKI